MKNMIILSKDEDQKRKEIARIMREETSYSVSRDDVGFVSRDEVCSTYSAMLVVANESGKGVHNVEIICKLYHLENRREIIARKTM